MRESVASGWMVFLLVLFSLVVGGQAQKADGLEDCEPSVDCGECTSKRDAFDQKLCGWCRSKGTNLNGTCVVGNWCPNVTNEVVYEGSQCRIVSEQDLFIVTVASISGAVVVLAVAGGLFLYRNLQQKKRRRELAAMQTAEKKRAARNKQRYLDQRVAYMSSHEIDGSPSKWASRNRVTHTEDARTHATWKVLSKNGLRVRMSPNPEAAACGLLRSGSIVESTARQGHWVRHAKGWSMIDDGTKHGRKFLQPVKRNNRVELGHRRKSDSDDDGDVPPPPPAGHVGKHFRHQRDGGDDDDDDDDNDEEDDDDDDGEGHHHKKHAKLDRARQEASDDSDDLDFL